MKSILILCTLVTLTFGACGADIPPSIKLLSHEEKTEKKSKPTLWGIKQADEEHVYQKFTIEIEAGSQGSLYGISYTHKDCNGHTQQTTYLHPWSSEELKSCPMALSRGEVKTCDLVFKAACPGTVEFQGNQHKW